ncbi:hypothetical protein TTHERM_000316259 (macronuclear) [Tetrahymena thermophila SB210]|uniref:Uncharacterized protein n=1 Tax=Tetrahymena thermophila (strain SB210) TaxID=312017 RepID=W7X1F2_TETTS|nr:hypothetical protein TTHERM_000316259 [Tetrahymena thermophila SB210]EWS73070.1 hypothetical protein TTHERM_000316259 [Tetrahymena thermophila SB210]|eukprot:XP_012654379.1 hypothetical protein TTHERM_000316259 [Tetrahymena thermophila SB210]
MQQLLSLIAQLQNSGRYLSNKGRNNAILTKLQLVINFYFNGRCKKSYKLSRAVYEKQMIRKAKINIIFKYLKTIVGFICPQEHIFLQKELQDNEQKNVFNKFTSSLSLIYLILQNIEIKLVDKINKKYINPRLYLLSSPTIQVEITPIPKQQAKITIFASTNSRKDIHQYLIV